MSGKLITYEQPVNELVRVCLRLEHLFQQVDSHLACETELHTSDIVKSIIDIVSILDRPDLKSKFTQEFNRLIKSFSSLSEAPGISKETLKETIDDLSELMHHFIDIKGKFSYAIRDDEFLATIRLHLTTPGGDCCFDMPAYHYWLNQPLSHRLTTISNWLTPFNRVREAVDLLLKIIRYSEESSEVIAYQGYYHDVLNSNPPSQLIRVTLPAESTLYPIMSVGKHRMNIRFMKPEADQRALQEAGEVNFRLTICNI